MKMCLLEFVIWPTDILEGLGILWRGKAPELVILFIDRITHIELIVTTELDTVLGTYTVLQS